MSADEHIDDLSVEGTAFRDAARDAGPEATVPTCPTWRVTELVRHLAFVHTWARHYVVDGVTEYQGDVAESDVITIGPSDGELWPFYSDALHNLVSALRTAPDDLSCWTVLPGLTPRASWARRQAHETAIHRADAERAAGRTVQPTGRDFALDGIDELIAGFLRRPLKDETLRGRILIAPSDSDDRWTVEVGERRSHGARGVADADVTVHGPASDIYFQLWNRLSPDSAVIDGDRALWDGWRKNQTVLW